MYLITIHVPIYTDGPRRLVTSDWRPDLIMLRDSLEGRFGSLCVLAPHLPVAAAADKVLEEVTLSHDGIDLVPSFDLRGRARHYWLRDRKAWKQILREYVSKADVVHAGLDNLFRPISYAGFREGLRQNRATVFVQDTDVVLQQGELASGQGWRCRTKTSIYSALYERVVRSAVAQADLSLLKGSALTRRYARYARNSHEFQHTMHATGDVLSDADLEARLLLPQSKLRLVYCGRLIPRKGVDRSIRLVTLARSSGVDVSLDLIGDGPCRSELESQIAAAGLTSVVQLHGFMPYGAPLLRRLSAYDAMLFTPTAEDTPRMIFDGYAAGLPLVASEIDYVKERAASEGATVLLPRDDDGAAASEIAGLARDRSRLATLARSARAAGLATAFEHWFRKRAQWTFEAVDRHRHANGSGTLAQRRDPQHSA